MRTRIWALALLTAALLTGCGSEREPRTPGLPSDFWGIAPIDSPNEADIARMAEGGIDSYHVLISWSQIETTKGVYDWRSYDILMRQLALNGIQPTPYIYGTTAVYEPAPSVSPTENPETFDAWAAFLEALALRYGPDGEFWMALASTDPAVEPLPMRTWEIWNEMNSSVFFTPKPDPDQYAALLKRSARVLQKVDPEAEIVTGGMFASPASENGIQSFEFLRRLYAKRGVADLIDVVGVHPYGPTLEGVFEQMDRTRETIDRAGGADAETWVTEIGWGSDPAAGSELAKTPARQAALLGSSLERLAAERERWDLRGVIWFTWRDLGEPLGGCSWCGSAGLVDLDRDTKPAWTAYTDQTGGEP